MSQRIVLGIGELLWDCFPGHRRPGGAPANVAFHATQLGELGMVCSRVGRDEDGDALLDHLRQRNVSTDCVQRDPHHPTSTVTVDTTRPDHPVYTIHEDVAWDALEFDDVLGDHVARAAAICFGTLAQRSPSSRSCIQEVLARHQGALVVYDINLREPWYAWQTIEQSLERCDVLKLSEAEVVELGRMLDLSAVDPEPVADALFARFDLRLVCVTRGGDGALALAPEERVEVPGHPVEVVDAVGAGDAFTAALIHGRLERWPLARTVRFANRVGALVASREGATPELGEAYRTLAESAAPGSG